MKIEELFEATAALFNKYTNYNSWCDDHGEDYDEIEIDGYKVGIIYDYKDTTHVVGLWYHKAGVGSISTNFASVYPKYADDFVFYAKQDPYYPYK